MDWFNLIPKVELHLHLEGAIPYPALWQLIEKYGGDPQVPNIEKLLEKFVFRDFEHFISTWVWKNNFLREYEDFIFIAKNVARDLADQNIRYAEIFFSPPDFFKRGLKTQRLVDAIWTGLSLVEGIEISLVPDLVRDFGPDVASVTLEELNEVRDRGIIGIGLGGSEHTYPPEPFKSIYERARELGLKTSVHTGEVAGADSIWGAIHELKPDRIGHGTRAQEDLNLMDYLLEHQIPIEMCPISNLKTGVVPSLRDHPIRYFYDHGLFVTVNTDDPKMFGNSLAEEYRALMDELKFSKNEIRTLIIQAIWASWLSDDRKLKMEASFQAYPYW